FFALPGDNRDGNEFAPEAIEKGAVAAIASRPGERILQVPDVLRALQDLAHWAARQWHGEIIGVTGSAGKTSTKDLIAEMLAAAFPTGKTEGNFNNHIGVPLSVLRLDSMANAAVLEYGMNHAGEIRDLAAIARPKMAVVTNVGAAHIENFDSIDDIAAAKRELVEALPPDGVAVLNADDPRVADFARVHPGRSILYGLSPGAGISAEEVKFSGAGARFRVGETQFETALPGVHSVRNILAGIAVASVYGIPADRLTEVVRGLKPGKMRGERIDYRGIQIINDCYNSNPDAAKAMLDLLAATPARRKLAVLGEMLELGRWSEALHRDVGFHAAKSGLAVLMGIRGAARFMVDAAMD
ncbi:MAG: UDP-N-acetylmuramoyl-tripeptide--D-alanyl-D-alanine ligase, partial [Bryobacteraceae bacterium]